jgi:arylsulfatase
MGSSPFSYRRQKDRAHVLCAIQPNEGTPSVGLREGGHGRITRLCKRVHACIQWRMRAVRGVLIAFVGILAARCTRQAATHTVVVRLVDLYKPAMIEGRAAGPQAPLPRTEWRFDGPGPTGGKFAATRGWEAGPGIVGLAVRDGRLGGGTSSDIPILHFERTSGLEDHDLVHALEIRARVSAGAALSLTYRDDEKIDLAEIAKRTSWLPWRAKVSLSPGPDFKTYTIDERQLERGVLCSEVRHLLIQPTNVKGASFEIESVRLVTRREHLSGIPSGLGWQGLGEIYRETLVARSPEAIRMKLTLPPRPLLDMAVGTIENGPVTFKVGVRSGQESVQLFERTLTTPHRWEVTPVDLGRFARKEVTLSLTLSSDTPGALGFWGAPAIRSLGAMPAAKAPARTAAEPPRGVILIWSDTTRSDHLSAYGYGRDTTPVLRRMAAEGALFQDCVGQATWTKVATPALLTSLYPLSNGVHDFADRLPNSAMTLAEVFRDAGYATLSMSSILFTGRFTNLQKGFEQVHEDGSLPDKESSKTARVYVDRLLPWLEAHREVPFFVFLHVSDPHDPYRPDPPYDMLFADPAKRENHERQSRDVKKFISAPLLKLFGMPSREELKKAGLDAEAYVSYDRDWYDGSIRGMDVEIGRLLEGLRGLGLEERTLVVYAGDHGEEFLEHGRTFHGQSTYGELANVPLILWRPGAVPKAAVVRETVETIDIMPTILEMSRLPVPASVQGRSLLPLLGAATPKTTATLADSGWRDRPAFTEKAVTESIGGPPPQNTEAYAIVSGGFRLVHHTKHPDGGPEDELFEHRVDPLDKVDVAAQHPEVVERLSKVIAAWRSRVEAARLKPDAASAQEMTKEQLERLRALGYIQ